MFKRSAFSSRKKSCRPLKEFYKEWVGTLKNTLLPQLRRVLSSASASAAAISVQMEALHHHFQSYYDALDHAAATNPASCIFPDWRNSLERPFLWFGDLHPYLFTNLIRSFLDDQETKVEQAVSNLFESRTFLEQSWHVVMAWNSPPRSLTVKLDQIECGLRLMVPALTARWRRAQQAFVENVGMEWVTSDGGKPPEEGLKKTVAKAVEAEMEELVGVIVDANRVRRSALADILSITSVYQAALFLEALAQVLVGFKDHKLLSEFDKCNIHGY